MKREDRRKKEKKFTIRMQKKLVVLFGVVLLVFAGFSITLPARRGDILDCKGTPLAVSKKYTIWSLIPRSL